MAFEQVHTLPRMRELTCLALHATKICERCSYFGIKRQALDPTMVHHDCSYTLMEFQCHNVVLSLSNGMSNSSSDRDGCTCRGIRRSLIASHFLTPPCLDFEQVLICFRCPSVQERISNRKKKGQWKGAAKFVAPCPPAPVWGMR